VTKDNPEQFIRDQKSIAVVHAEAFQLMLYRAEDGSEAWFWNSRDGVTPFITTIDGKQYRHAMHGYPTRYQAVIPAEAEYVWVSYDREVWTAMEARKFEAFTARTDKYGEDFRDRFPNMDDWLAVTPFEHGQPRQMTRSEYLQSTSEWMGKGQGD
jgi:hypothetical protein